MSRYDGNVADLIARAAARTPDRSALIGPEKTLTWAEYDRRVGAAAAAFAGLGARPGDRIVIQLGNGPDFPVACFGALRAGLVAVPVDPQADATELLAGSGARLLMTAQVAAIRAPRPPDVQLVVAGGHPADGAHRLADLAASAQVLEPVRGGGEGPAVLAYPTGSGAQPRGVLLSHRALLAGLGELARIDPAPIRPADVVLVAVPLFHPYGMWTGLAWAAHVGAAAVIGPDAGLAELPQHRVSVVLAAPGVFARWLAEAPRYELARAFATVRLALSGSAPLPAAVADAVTAATQVVVHDSYGLAETGPVLTTTLLSPQRKPGSVGRPVPGVQLWLRDEDGGPAGVGDPGEIVVRSAALFSGYRPEDGTVTDADGWFRTGDAGYLDEDGDLFVLGRRREAIAVDGFTVYPAEVEAALVSHPAVAEVAVVGTDGPREAITAFVVTVAGAQVAAEELIGWSAQRLARFKRPARVQFVPELPHSATGRVRRTALKGAE